MFLKMKKEDEWCCNMWRERKNKKKNKILMLKINWNFHATWNLLEKKKNYNLYVRTFFSLHAVVGGKNFSKQLQNVT